MNLNLRLKFVFHIRSVGFVHFKEIILGCCWEEDESVLEQYPFTPQCYQRVGGKTTPSNVPALQALFARSGK